MVPTKVWNLAFNIQNKNNFASLLFVMPIIKDPADTVFKTMNIHRHYLQLIVIFCLRIAMIHISNLKCSM